MDYEKAYKEALERAIEVYQGSYRPEVAVVLAEKLPIIFPELKESEDEKIRKGLIDYLWGEKIFLQEAHTSVENNPKYRFVMNAIAWLEKQGGQKLTNEDEEKIRKEIFTVKNTIIKNGLYG